MAQWNLKINIPVILFPKDLGDGKLWGYNKRAHISLPGVQHQRWFFFTFSVSEISMQTGLQDRDEYRKEADQLLAVDAMRNADVWASVAMEVVIKCHNGNPHKEIYITTSLDCNDYVFLNMWVPIWSFPDFPIAPCHETWKVAKLSQLRGTSFTGGVEANHCHRLTERAGEAFSIWRIYTGEVLRCVLVA